LVNKKHSNGKTVRTRRLGGAERHAPQGAKLVKTEEPKRIDVVLFADPPESQAEIDFIRDDVVNGMIGVEAAVGITAGDNMFDACLSGCLPSRPKVVSTGRRTPSLGRLCGT
jgi:hypothetical protein